MQGNMKRPHFRAYEEDIFFGMIQNSGLARDLHPVHQLVNQCLQQVADAAAHSDIGVDIAGDLEALPPVHVDVTAARHAMCHLLTQAISASPRGSSVRLSVWPENGHVMFAIADSGAGLHPSAIHQLDAMGADEAMPHAVGPHGIALPVSKTLIGMHGGHFRVESAKDAGTTVTFSFPHAAEETSFQAA